MEGNIPYKKSVKFPACFVNSVEENLDEKQTERLSHALAFVQRGETEAILSGGKCGSNSIFSIHIGGEGNARAIIEKRGNHFIPLWAGHHGHYDTLLDQIGASRGLGGIPEFKGYKSDQAEFDLPAQPDMSVAKGFRRMPTEFSSRAAQERLERFTGRPSYAEHFRERAIRTGERKPLLSLKSSTSAPV